jgi:Zn-dependent protease
MVILIIGIVVIFQLFCIVPVYSTDISISQKTVHAGEPIVISIKDLKDESSVKFQLEGDIVVPEGKSFSFETSNLNLPFSLESAKISGTIQGSTDNSMIIEKGEYQITRKSKSTGGFLSTTLPLPITAGTYDLIAFQGTSFHPQEKTDLVHIVTEISGVKEGPDDSEMTFGVDGINTGTIGVRILVDGEPALDDQIAFTPTGVTPAEVASSIIVGTGLGLAGAGAASAGASAAASTSSNFIIVFLKNAGAQIRDYLGENFSERLTDFEIERRALSIGLNQKPFLGVIQFEVVVGVAGSLLFGLASLIAYRAPFSLDSIAIYFIAAGVAIMVHEVAHWYAARRLKKATEIQFWGLGTVIMFLTGWLSGNVFGQPCRTMIEGVHEMEGPESGKIMLAGPLVSVGVAAASIPLIYMGGDLARIGQLSIILNLVLAVYHMMPFKPMDGKVIYKWNRMVWAIVFFPILMAYIYTFFM